LTALLLILAALAVVLSVIGISVLRTKLTPAPVASERAPVVTPPPPAPVTAPIAAPTPDPVTSAIDEVIPDVAPSAQQTIRGTIKVIIRVTVDKTGTVLATSTIVPGPSRYFERVATEAARKWTFTPAPSQEQRAVRITFSFTRGGATASASSPK
jgi:TonB family protein